ncbi:MAG: hypothetical protein P8I94_06685 [Emcibacteraceae bacterium]|nr:hypothetical protein [Emcibacteraceae bacterium]
MAQEVRLDLVANDKASGQVKKATGEIKEAKKEQGLFAAQTDKVKKAFKGLKGGVKQVITTFKTLKGAIAATGIGLLVIALGALVTFFTKTQRGADMLSEVMAGLGAAVDVIVDRVSKFGGAIVKFFSGDVIGAVSDMKDTFTGLGDEIAREAREAIGLKRELNALLDLEREFSVQKAKNNVIIREAEALALNENVALKERAAGLEQAMTLIMQQSDQEEILASRRLEAIKSQNALGESTREDLQREADAEINLINIRAEKARTEKRLITQLQTLKKQLATENEVNRGIELRQEEGVQSSILLATKTANQLRVEDAISTNGKLIDTRKKLNVELLKSETALSKSEQLLRSQNTNSQLAAAGQLAGALGQLAGDNKELAVAQAIIQTYLGANTALASAPPPVNFISAAAVIASGLANVKNILSTDVGGGSGGSVPNISSVGGNIAASIPAATGLGDVVESINGQANQPVEAFVIAQNVTDSQEAQSYINNQRTL